MIQMDQNASGFSSQLALDLLSRREYPNLLEYLQPFADGGEAAAQCVLGTLYQLGTGVPQDGLLAVSWLQKAADQDDPIAWNNLGTVFQSGSPGVAPDLIESARCYDRASKLGFDRFRGR